MSDGTVHVVRVGITILADSSEAAAFANALYTLAEEFARERGFDVVRPGEGEIGVYELRPRRRPRP